MSRPIARGTRALGYAGLLPQAAGLVAVLAAPTTSHELPALFVFGYASLILSFLGGIWWGFAMQRERGQVWLAALAVVPSLVPVVLTAVAVFRSWNVALILLGSAVFATLLVDRRLVAAGNAPADWMTLRVPLSLGLGSLTIAAGLVSS